ncbi:hypothetical protein [Siccirubricoccus sp. G192]|uniref:hypothetical protein n=1 Tax=Siccirubricoccus sp. G192 TaxID=2849651 RepID=UPI001C2C5AD0|nr:hypothetical protein [Siccirubricoccus sp. G192]MBV1796870.1 hypothetical protein [Siccirubricoccus sp. G192]
MEVRPVATRAEAAAFLRLPARLGGEAAGWSVPLLLDTRRFFDPGFNGLLRDHAVARFLAWRDGRPAGRIAAGWHHGDLVGNFGFLALEPDPAVLEALLRAAGAWLGAHGAARLRGPLSLTINHEVGALVEGFGRPGMVRMPRTPPWLPGMLEAAGLAPEKDVLACTLTLAKERHRARFGPLLARWPEAAGLRVRPLDSARFEAEIRLVTALYNDAWAANWGAVPVGEAEAATIARLMRPLLRGGAILIAEWQGEPIGVLSLLPNLEEATEGLHGRLLPLGWWRVARVALLGRSRSGRVPMLGISRRWRGHPVSAMAVGALLNRAITLAIGRGWESLEISWILEDNAAMLQTMARLPAPVTGRWRIYGAPIGGA